MTAEAWTGETAINAEIPDAEIPKPEKQAFVMPFLFEVGAAHNLETLLGEWCEPTVTDSVVKAAALLGGLILVGLALAPALLNLMISSRVIESASKEDTLDPVAVILLAGLGCVVGLAALLGLAEILFNDGGDETVRQRRIVKHLARYNDVRVVRPLIHTLNWHDPSCRSEAHSGLLRMLPVLNESDSLLLSDYDRSVLTGHLEFGDAMLRQVILKALFYVGRSSDLPALRPITEGKGSYRHEEREAARTCVAAIEERAQREAALYTLLRPSSGENANPNEMVRPAAAPAADPPEQLLRAQSESL